MHAASAPTPVALDFMPVCIRAQQLSVDIQVRLLEDVEHDQVQGGKWLRQISHLGRRRGILPRLLIQPTAHRADGHLSSTVCRVAKQASGDATEGHRPYPLGLADLQDAPVAQRQLLWLLANWSWRVDDQLGWQAEACRCKGLSCGKLAAEVRRLQLPLAGCTQTRACGTMDDIIDAPVRRLEAPKAGLVGSIHDCADTQGCDVSSPHGKASVCSDTGQLQSIDKLLAAQLPR
mmetsp:Transcript_24505/g.70377  ORF Transcript_24505/g.70377 Transcript_24505/m.70377 type:complete len:233 (-) Transcript_24505:169-867(-)